MVSSGKGLPLGHWKGQEPFNRWPTLTFCADESRGARRCQLKVSIGALELPNMAGALTPVAWLLWMLQLVNVTLVLDPEM